MMAGTWKIWICLACQVVCLAGCTTDETVSADAASVSPAEVPAEPVGKPYGDPTRFERAIERFEKQDAKAAPPEGAVLFVGSSSIRMWHDRLAEDVAPLTVVGRGFGGSNMNDLLHYLDRVVIPYRPRAVVIYEGDNAIAQGVSPKMIADTFDQVVSAIHDELPGCRVYMLSIKPSPARWEMWPAMLRANRLLAEACAADDRLTYIDLSTPMLGNDGEPRPELYVKDRLHLTREGYELWRSILRPVLMAGERRYESE